MFEAIAQAFGCGTKADRWLWNAFFLQSIGSLPAKIVDAILSAMNQPQLSQVRPEELIRRYKSLLDVSRAISSTQNQTELFSELAHHLRQVVRFDFLNVVLHEPAHNVMRLYLLETARHRNIEPGVEFPIDESFAGWVWKHHKPYIITNVEEETQFPRTLAILREHLVKSYCLLPLMSAHRCLGILGFGNVSEAAYSQADLDFMQQAANQVAVSLDNALNYKVALAHQQQLSRERDRLGLLLDVTNALVSSLDFDELFAAVTDCMRRVIPHDYASVALHDPESNLLRFHAVEVEGLVRPPVHASAESTPAGMAFSSGKPTLFDSEGLKRFSSAAIQTMLGDGVQSLCCIPLITKNGVLGTLNIGSRQVGAFQQDDVDLLSQVAAQTAIALDNALAYQQIAVLKDKLSKEKLYLEDEIRTEGHFGAIVGGSKPLKKVLQLVETVAPTDSTVLVRGETGTGKELIARAIHNLSSRRERTFVKLNCAAIPTGLLESELFGHEKGAFTGAIAQRIGRFELAHLGTLFLDEVGDIPLELQPKLLRVLQEMEFERLGSSRTIRVSVRLVAATNRDLSLMVREGQFRSDLFYRLNIFPISVPPLRERQEDIPKLIRYFAQKYSLRLNKKIASIASGAMEALSRYSWPGNIRELENFVERAVILSRGNELELPIAELRLRDGHVSANDDRRSKDRRAHRQKSPLANQSTSEPGTMTLEDAEREHILQVLRASDWQVGGPQGAAARLGMKRTTLNSKMKRLSINRTRS
jgi:formate hydrogenlyase transcriptional activator